MIKMDGLDIAIELLIEARDEKTRLEEYNKEYNKTLKIGDSMERWNEQYKINQKYYPIPKRQVIKDNIKMARRLLLKEYK